MGVMACDRGNCPNIMCELMLDVGQDCYYLCSDCDKELQQAKNEWPRPMTLAALHDHVRAFMKTNPGSETELDEDGIDAEMERMRR